MFSFIKDNKDLEERVQAHDAQIGTIIKDLMKIQNHFNLMLEQITAIKSRLTSVGPNTITVSSTDVKWGTKKDGTPRRKPGRKPAREVFNKGAKK